MQYLFTGPSIITTPFQDHSSTTIAPSQDQSSLNDVHDIVALKRHFPPHLTELAT